MATEMDPRGAEPAALFGAADLPGARVLEIGCGDGRLTFRYAEACRFTVGIDTVVDEVLTARAARPVGLRSRLTFWPASALALPFRDRVFDIALLAWSL